MYISNIVVFKEFIKSSYFKIVRIDESHVGD